MLGWLGALLFASAMAGCSDGGSGCTTCAAGSMTVSLTAVATTYASHLPLSIKLCVAGACSSFKIVATGQAPVCDSESGGDEVCSIDGMGSIVVSSLPLPDTATPGSSVTVSATLTDEDGIAFNGSQAVTVMAAAVEAGECGSCTSAGAVFDP